MITLFVYLWLLAVAAGLLSLLCIHAWQMEAYKPPQYMRWLRADGSRVYRSLAVGWLRSALLLITVMIPASFLAALRDWPALIPAATAAAAAALAAGAIWSMILFIRTPHKKPMKFTARIRRLLASLILLAAVLAVALLIPADMLARILHGEGAFRVISPVIVLFLFFTVAAAVQPLMVVLGGIVMRPVENRIIRWYYNDAKQKLASWDQMIKIGITGSYGKTSTKVILGTILRQRYETMVTPHSYNTPMGVTRTVREQMTGREEVFVAEMGARQRWDIAEMCDLVAPRYGLLTSVGPQHLETFGSIENVARTKYELIESLPDNGWAFFPSDNEICLELYRKTAGNKLLFGFDGHGEPLYMTALDVETTPEGSEFTLADAEGGTVRCVTRLLGRHNIINILGCAAVARKLGLTLEQIAAGIRLTDPVEHRLQLIPTGNGVTVIDDAFNASPDGTRAALGVLGSFSGRKIIVTPGLVELGEAEERENRAFGENMAAVADIVILVSRNGEAIEQGLRQGQYTGRIIRVGNLKEASQELAGITRAGDVVLFENDLPDHYEQ